MGVFEKKDQEFKENVLRVGPVEAGISREELEKIARSLVTNRTLKSTAMSVAAGLPGGLAMAATIPADTLQYFGMSLRLAQEIAYLYGEEDLWSDGNLNNEKVTNTLINLLRCNVWGIRRSSLFKSFSISIGETSVKEITAKDINKNLLLPNCKKPG